MSKIDRTVLKETAFIGTVSIILSLALQSVFLILLKWDYTVFLGNILGIIACVGNFLLMGITVQNSLEKEEKDAKNAMKLSLMLRTLMLFLIAVIAYVVPIFNVIATVIPYLFPRIAILIRPLILKDK